MVRTSLGGGASVTTAEISSQPQRWTGAEARNLLESMAVSFGALAVGLVGGEILSRHIDHELARRLAIGLALGGAVFTVIKGILTW